MFGFDNGIFQLDKNNKGWHSLNIPKKYKTLENYETFCQLNYMGIDAEAEFINKILEIK